MKTKFKKFKTKVMKKRKKKKKENVIATNIIPR